MGERIDPTDVASARARARELQAEGRSALGIVQGLREWSAATIAVAIYGTKGLGFDERAVAWALRDVGVSDDGIASVFRHGLRFDAGPLAMVLQEVLGASPKAVARTLRDTSNAGVAEIAAVLHGVMRMGVGEIAEVLHAEDGLGADPETVVDAFRGSNDIPSARITGLAVPAKAVAKALHDTIGLDPGEVAKAMYLRFHGRYDERCVAQVLSSADGLDLPAAEVAKALKDGLGLDASAVACTLCSPQGIGLDDHVVAHALYRGGWPNVCEVAQALRNGAFMTGHRIGVALRKGLWLDAQAVARVVHSTDGLAFTVGETATVLYDSDGLDLDADLVARVLHKGLGLDVRGVAQALDSGCVMSATLIAIAINHGLDLDLDAAQVDRMLRGDAEQAEALVPGP